MDLYKVLEFLENTGYLYTLDYAKKYLYSSKLSNYIFDMFDITEKSSLGVVYTKPIKIGEQYIVDGISRLVGISLFLFAVCECWKNTTERNELLIRKIKANYLLRNGRPKILLNSANNDIYEPLLLGDRISGKNKKTIIFCTYHEYWTKLKLGNYDLKDIMDKLDRLYLYNINLTDMDAPQVRDFYYSLNIDNQKLNQIALIRDFLKEENAGYEWSEIEQLFYNNKDYLMMFLRDYLITKYKIKKIPYNNFYLVLKGYINELKKYKSVVSAVEDMHASAIIYNNILNVDIQDEDIKNKFVEIKLNKGNDTYAYLLEIYEDYRDGNITKETFLEILTAINEYLVTRNANPSSRTNFNDLISDLNKMLYGDGDGENSENIGENDESGEGSANNPQ